MMKQRRVENSDEDSGKSRSNSLKRKNETHISDCFEIFFDFTNIWTKLQL